MKIRMIVSVFLLIAGVSQYQLLYADLVSDQRETLIKDYVRAIYRGNPQLADSLRTKIARDPKTIAYMKEKMPKYWNVFELDSVAAQLDAIRGQYQNSPRIHSSSPALTSKGAAPSNLTNRDLILLKPNRENRLNQQIARSSRNQDQISNSHFSPGLSNRSQISNQERLRKR